MRSRHQRGYGEPREGNSEEKAKTAAYVVCIETSFWLSREFEGRPKTEAQTVGLTSSFFPTLIALSIQITRSGTLI